MSSGRFSGRWQCASALGLLLVVAVAGYLSITRPVMAKHRFYQDRIESMEQRLQRLGALIAARPALEQRLARLQQDQSSKRYYLAENTAALAATGLRTLVKQTVQSSGATLVSTQNLPVDDSELFPRVTLKVQMTGSTEALQRVLHGLESRRPYLFVNDLRVRAREIRRRRPRRRSKERRLKIPVSTETRLTVGFELSGYLRARRGAG